MNRISRRRAAGVTVKHVQSPLQVLHFFFKGSDCGRVSLSYDSRRPAVRLDRFTACSLIIALGGGGGDSRWCESDCVQEPPRTQPKGWTSVVKSSNPHHFSRLLGPRCSHSEPFGGGGRRGGASVVVKTAPTETKMSSRLESIETKTKTLYIY